MTRLRGGAVTAVAVLVAVTGCKSEHADGAAGPENNGSGGAAMTAAGSLTVKGRAPKTGYSRARFGSAWADTGSNSCDTRVISMLHTVMGLFSQRMQGVVDYA